MVQIQLSTLTTPSFVSEFSSLVLLWTLRQALLSVQHTTLLSQTAIIALIARYIILLFAYQWKKKTLLLRGFNKQILQYRGVCVEATLAICALLLKCFANTQQTTTTTMYCCFCYCAVCALFFVLHSCIDEEVLQTPWAEWLCTPFSENGKSIQNLGTLFFRFSWVWLSWVTINWW